jgi:hypothetical protein
LPWRKMSWSGAASSRLCSGELQCYVLI